MQQLIACSKDTFAFGEPDKVVLRDYNYLLPEDCLPLSQIRRGIADSKYGYRYKLLWDGIASFFENDELISSDAGADQFFVALIVISSGPLFVDIRRCIMAIDKRPELLPANSGLHLQFYIPVTATDQTAFIWPAIGQAYDIPASLSQSELKLAKNWLKDCIAGSGKHQRCGIHEDPPILPTRVIDVGSSDEEICLHISQAEEKSQYVALSHCWGGAVTTMTTTSTIHAFVTSLPSKLPKTFIDAITVTRTLGQRYLWIDSLCILQDSEEDWITESSQMDRVYSQALFTIVADAANNSSSGFLEPPTRNSRKTSIVTCDFTTSTSTTSLSIAIHVRERGELAFQLPYHDFHSNSDMEQISCAFPNKPETVIRSKLSTRAWAFQERLLSPRTLHFGPSEMAWECQTICSCECSATNERTSRTTSMLKGSIALRLLPILSEESPQNLSSARSDAWQRDIVEEYTRLDLTRETDRLSALAGLATRASIFRPGDQYIAGMWRKTIAEDLAWYTRPENSSRRPLTKDQAPTWSWTSVTGHIQYSRTNDTLRDNPLIEVLDVQYIPKRQSLVAAGPAAPASLRVSGYLIPIASVWYQPYRFVPMEDKPEEGTFYLTGEYRSCYRIKWPSNVELPENCVAMMDIHPVLEPYDEKIRLNRLDGMELESSKWVMLLMALGKGVVCGLVLSPCYAQDKVSGYERVGFVNGLDSIGRLQWLQIWTSTGYSRSGNMFNVDWEAGEGALDSILKRTGINKSIVRIW
ncbi:hypothetical protein BGAL_0559g00030 [Botrytis galanthina]|uniref:Heterokaryon incompatibility domain-containing protein n=1 Tax=Botrytis galanthina TaxID=278940 RepID=A0A4S8QJB5_9HELO|nr:hypothetical protein BGAL_0559g00030 [Botrytis galanthina]